MSTLPSASASPLFDTYVRMPMQLVRGEGVWLYDDRGQRYLDALSGIAVCSLGHAHPEIADAIADQARTLIHTANIVHLPLQTELGAALSALSGLDRAFIANSGLEAIECALKLARRHAHARGIPSPAIIVAEHSFHGRSLAALSASGSAAIQEGYGPLVEGFLRVPYGDAEAVAECMATHPNVVAVLVESIQGEGGVRVPPDDYLPRLRALCDAHQALLMLDEIQAGMGRTGRWFGFQHYADLKPDVITVAKALGNGVPIGACVAKEAVAALMPPGSHGTTFGGNPLACRVALKVIEIMQRDGLLEHSQRMGQRLQAGLREALGRHPNVVEVRGRGLMVGVELSEVAPELKEAAMHEGVIMNVTRGNVIRLLPPMVIQAEQIDRMIEVVSQVVHRHFESRSQAAAPAA